MNNTSKNICITGAGNGIGRAIAIAMSKQRYQRIPGRPMQTRRSSAATAVPLTAHLLTLRLILHIIKLKQIYEERRHQKEQRVVLGGQEVDEGGARAATIFVLGAVDELCETALLLDLARRIVTG